MITITYLIPITGGQNLASQLADAAAARLNQGELAMLGLTIASESTTHVAPNIERTVQFNETPAFVERVGLPFTDAKRKAMVKGLFSYKLSLELKKHVGETIVLTP